MTFTAEKTVLTYQYKTYDRFVAAYDANGSPLYEQSDTNYTWHETDTRTGVGLLNWRKVIQQGGNATTPLSGNRYMLEAKPGEAYGLIRPNTPNEQLYIFSGFDAVFPGPNTDWMGTTNAEQQARHEFYKKLRAHNSKFQGGVFIGELGEALRMLRHPAKRLFEGVGDYLSTLHKRRKGIRVPKRKRHGVLSGILSDTWLEYSFGWVPFIHDLSDANEALEDVLREKPRGTLKGVGFDEEFVTPSYLDNSLNTSAIPVKIRWNEIRKKVVVIYTGGLREVPYGVSTDKAFKAMGLALQDFVPTVWELIPWSFLVDYFVNVGQVLTDVTTSTEDVTWYSKTTVWENQNLTTCILDAKKQKQSWGGTAQLWGTAPKSVVTARKVSRGPISSVPWPSFTVKVPGRPQQWLNMVTLGARLKAVQPYL